MNEITIKISVDTIELDHALEKAAALSELINKVQGQIDELGGKKPLTMNYQVVSAIDPEKIKEMLNSDHCKSAIKEVITKPTSR